MVIIIPALLILMFIGGMVVGYDAGVKMDLEEAVKDFCHTDENVFDECSNVCYAFEGTKVVVMSKS